MTLKPFLFIICVLLLGVGCRAQQTAEEQQVDIDQWQVLKQEVMKSPFEHQQQFSVNLSLFGPKDWAYPLPGAKVISNFGGARHHAGTDLKRYGPGFDKDTIFAAFAGTVVMEGPYFAYGKFIVIRHANGLETAYSHNSKHLVKQGQWVRAGQPIAIVGRTGRATTAHLHFEVRVDGQAFDSSQIFDHANHRLRQRKMVFTKPKEGRKIRITYEE